jgi:hypothetical protein
MRDLVAVILIGMLECVGVLERGECARDDEESGQQDPGEETSKDVVDTRDLV